MALISIYKVVSSVPASLDANAVYLVRTGTGFDLYVSDSTGSIAYQINSSAAGLSNIVEDTTPQLGGDLDLNGNDVTGTGNISIAGEIEADIHIGSLRGEIQFKAKAGEALTKGDPVYISSYDTVGNTPIVAIADANDSAKMPCFGLANESVSLNASVNVVTFGTLSGLDTSGFGLGDTLYISNTGTLTNSKPTGESSLIQNIGKVQRVDNSAGSIKVGGAGRTNDVPNLNQGNVFIGNASNQAETRGLTLDDIAETATNKHFTSGDKSKLNGIESGATADQTDAEIKTAYENNANTNAFTDVEKTKLSGIAAGAEVNVNVDWNAVSGDAQILNKPTTITSAEQAKLGHISITQAVDLDTMESNVATNNAKVSNATHTGDVTGSTALTISDEAVTNAKIAHVATGTVKGRATAGTGDVEDLDIDTTLKTALNLTKSDVGLANVDNTSDLNKPISSATQTALNGKEPSFTKNTAFNKNFGTVSGTVAEGNDSRFTNHLSSFTQNSGQHIATEEIKAKDANGLKLWGTTSSGIFVAANGYVGMGTTAPADKFTVGNSATFDTGGTASMSILAPGENADAILYFGTQFQSDPQNPRKAAIIAEGQTTYSRSKLHFCLEDTATNASSANASLSNSRMAIQANGNVGIGTTSPSAKLDVNGDATIRQDVDIDGELSVTNTTSGTNQYGFGNAIARIVHDTQNSAYGEYGLHIGVRVSSGDTWMQTARMNSQNLPTNGDQFNLLIQPSAGNVGIGTTSPSAKLDVNGNVIISGSVSKASGSFDIPHPDPAKKDTHRLRHYFVETPSAGGNIYKYQLECRAGDNYIDLPDYFEHLNKDSLVWANPFKHFGRAWGEVIDGGKRAKIVCEQSGIYNILIFGDRKDEIALKEFDQYGVEYKIDKNKKK